MSLAAFYAEMSNRITEAGTQAAWCKANGVSPAYLCDVMNGRREPGDKILRALGWKRVITYRASNT